MNTTTDADLTQLQAQIAYNERALGDLSNIVADQAAEIDKLKAEMAVLGRQILQLTEGEVGSH